jgi:hypothetical protein
MCKDDLFCMSRRFSTAEFPTVYAMLLPNRLFHLPFPFLSFLSLLFRSLRSPSPIAFLFLHSFFHSVIFPRTPLKIPFLLFSLFSLYVSLPLLSPIPFRPLISPLLSQPPCPYFNPSLFFTVRLPPSLHP